jgi:hypothetical protein
MLPHLHAGVLLSVSRVCPPTAQCPRYIIGRTGLIPATAHPLVRLVCGTMSLQAVRASFRTGLVLPTLTATTEALMIPPKCVADRQPPQCFSPRPPSHRAYDWMPADAFSNHNRAFCSSGGHAGLTLRTNADMGGVWRLHAGQSTPPADMLILRDHLFAKIQGVPKAHDPLSCG